MSIKMNGFTIHIDSDGEWFEVDMDDLAGVGLSPGDFSNESRRLAGRMFLYDETDAEIFIEAYDKSYGEVVPMMYTTMNYDGHCFIRKLRSIKESDA